MPMWAGLGWGIERTEGSVDVPRGAFADPDVLILEERKRNAPSAHGNVASPQRDGISRRDRLPRPRIMIAGEEPTERTEARDRLRGPEPNGHDLMRRRLLLYAGKNGLDGATRIGRETPSLVLIGAQRVGEDARRAFLYARVRFLVQQGLQVAPRRVIRCQGNLKGATRRVNRKTEVDPTQGEQLVKGSFAVSSAIPSRSPLVSSAIPFRSPLDSTRTRLPSRLVASAMSMQS